MKTVGELQRSGASAGGAGRGPVIEPSIVQIDGVPNGLPGIRSLSLAIGRFRGRCAGERIWRRRVLGRKPFKNNDLRFDWRYTLNRLRQFKVNGQLL